MNLASISVVIPTYNRGHLVGEAVASVLAQTVPLLEVIVVDDGSTDDTFDRLRPYMPQIIYCRQENQGVSAARNLGIREAHGEFIAFLDSDDVWHPRKLELQLQVFGEQPDLGLLGTGAMEWPVRSFPEIAEDPRGHLTFVTWSQLAVRNRLGTSSVMIRSDLVRRVGGFDPVLKGPEDRDLWLRLADQSTVAILELPLVGWGRTAGNLSADVEKCQAGMLRTLRKLDERGAWQKGHWLRNRSYAHIYHECAYLYMQRKSYGRSIENTLKSLAWYPLPFARDEVQTPFERPKRLMIAALRIFRLVSEDPGAYRTVALQSHEEQGHVASERK
jgi:glycosyltransferase involved in cell wall biosynthesis